MAQSTYEGIALPPEPTSTREANAFCRRFAVIAVEAAIAAAICRARMPSARGRRSSGIGPSPVGGAHGVAGGSSRLR
jgi:hypothetical protein